MYKSVESLSYHLGSFQVLCCQTSDITVSMTTKTYHSAKYIVEFILLQRNLMFSFINEVTGNYLKSFL